MCGQAQGSVSTISATENSVTLALNLTSDIDPVAYTWSATAGPFTQPNTPMLTITNPQYPFVGSVVVTVASTCTYAFTFQIQGPLPTCDVDFEVVVDDNFVSIFESYNGSPVNANVYPNYTSEYTVNGTILATSHNPSFYLPEVGTYTICNSVASQGCTNEICHDLIITALDPDCVASFDYYSSGYEYTFFNTSTGFYTDVDWYVDGSYYSSGEYLVLTLSPDEYTTVELMISNTDSGCDDTHTEEVIALEEFTVCGYVFLDSNEDYTFNSQESGVSGVRIINSMSLDTVWTDVNGYYEITVFPGYFSLDLFLEHEFNYFSYGWGNTYSETSSTYNLEGCQMNFPVFDNEATVCGKVFFDANQNNFFDLGEPALSGAQIVFTYFDINQIQNEVVAYSNENGDYCIFATSGYYDLTCYYTLPSGAVVTQMVIPETGYYDPFFVNEGNNAPIYFIEDAIEVGISVSSFNNATPGFSGEYIVTLENSGSIDAVVDFSVQFPNTQEIVGTPQFQGETGVWNSTTNTLTFSNISISGFSQSSVNINILNSVNSVLGDLISIVAQASVNNGSDVNLNNNNYTLSQIIIGSYDPNNKLCNPSGQNTDGQMLPTNDPFTYTINFQNTGTAPAYTVRVEDQLDSDLDWTSFEMLYASHAYSVQMQDGYLIWTFNEIMLPDSNSNEPESHGHIVFRIKPIADKPVGTIFENTAYIYFDFNEPIITNTAINTFVSEVGVAEEEEPSLFVRPNPANDFVIVSSDLLNGDAMIRLLDMQGRLVLEQKVTNINQFQLPLSVDAGQYIIQIQNRENVGASRLVVR